MTIRQSKIPFDSPMFDHIATMSQEMPADFTLLPGYSHLYSCPQVPGLVLRVLAPGTHGRGAHALGFFNPQGSFLVMVGHSLVGFAGSFKLGGPNPFTSMQAGFTVPSPISSADTLETFETLHLGNPVLTFAANFGGGGSGYGPTHNAQYTVPSERIATQTRATTFRRAGDYQGYRCVEVLTSAESGVITNGVVPGNRILGADASFGNASQPAIGYLGKALEFGRASVLLGDPGVKAALKVLYTDPIVKPHFDTQYPIALAEFAASHDEDISIAAYFSIHDRHLYGVNRSLELVHTKSSSLVTAFVGLEGHVGPASNAAVNDVYFTPTLGFGSRGANAQVESFLPLPHGGGVMPLTNGMLGQHKLARFQQSMLPATEFVQSSLDVRSALQLNWPQPPEATTNTGPETAILASRALADLGEADRLVGKMNADNVIPDNFQRVIFRFSQMLDERILEAAR